MEGRVLYHSIVKSIRGRVIFYKDSDRLLFLNILRRFVDKHSVIILEFVLMDNHIHLLHTAQSEEHAVLFLSEMQQNFAFWYNRFHSTHDKLLVPAKVYPKYTEEMKVNCSLYILQNPMVASRDGYPHPKYYKWSSYHYHYDFMNTAPRLVSNSKDVIRANKMFDLINCSKSIQYNKCPLLRSGFVWPILKLSDILPVNTFEMDRLYTKHEFKVIVGKTLIPTNQEEFTEEQLVQIKNHLSRTKETVASLSEFLLENLNGRSYRYLPQEEKENLIIRIFSCTKATQMQIVILLDEDKDYVKNLYLKYRFSKASKLFSFPIFFLIFFL